MPRSASQEHDMALEHLKERYLQFKVDPNTLLHVHFKTQQDAEMREFLVVDKNPEDVAHHLPHSSWIGTQRDIISSQAGQRTVLFPKDTCNIATANSDGDFHPQDVAVRQEYGEFDVQQDTHCRRKKTVRKGRANSPRSKARFSRP